mmetsp:Transcript_12835/g.35544  ORF Transcript_12835/g.35544 Transcript_12835/m.35544 type:complete len:83 (+) Transcript_12835:590-838(+)
MAVVKGTISKLGGSSTLAKALQPLTVFLRSTLNSFLALDKSNEVRDSHRSKATIPSLASLKGKKSPTGSVNCNGQRRMLQLS